MLALFDVCTGVNTIVIKGQRHFSCVPAATGSKAAAATIYSVYVVPMTTV